MDLDDHPIIFFCLLFIVAAIILLVLVVVIIFIMTALKGNALSGYPADFSDQRGLVYHKVDNPWVWTVTYDNVTYSYFRDIEVDHYMYPVTTLIFTGKVSVPITNWYDGWDFLVREMKSTDGRVLYIKDDSVYANTSDLGLHGELKVTDWETCPTWL